MDEDARAVVENVVDSPSTIITVYEGGPRELFVSLGILQRSKSLRLVFNFFDLERWVKVFANKQFLALLTSLQYHPRIQFMREVNVPHKLWPREISTCTFPIFSNLSITEIPTNQEKLSAALFVYDHKTLASTGVSQALQRIANYQVLHIFCSKRNQRRVRAVLGEIASLPDLLFHTSNISNREYCNILAESRFSLFVFKPGSYKLKSSGRVEDAIMCQSTPLIYGSTGPTFQNSRALNNLEALSTTDQIADFDLGSMGVEESLSILESYFPDKTNLSSDVEYLSELSVKMRELRLGSISRISVLDYANMLSVLSGTRKVVGWFRQFIR